MYSDTVHYASEGRAQLSLDRMRSSKLEPEIIFSIREPLNAESADPGAALNAMEWISLGFEIIDCPYSDWKFQPADFVASFGLHAALIVGEPTRVEREAIPSLVEQLPQFKVKMFKNGEFVEEGAGKNSLRSPALCLVELSLALVRKPGAQGLRPGDLISSGTLTSGHTLGRGECWRVEVEGLPGSPLTLITT
jgi:2-keto-4-pentenoate hydratase